MRAPHRWRRAWLAVALAGCVQSVQVLEGPDETFGDPTMLVDATGAPLIGDDPTFSSDELEIYFAVSDIVRATRASTDDPFGPPTVVTELSSGNTETDPRLTADDLGMYFVSYRDDPLGDIYFSSRASTTSPWTAPTRLVELSTAQRECCMVVDASSTHALLVSYIDTGEPNVYASERASTDAPWGPMTLVDALNAPAAHDQLGMWRGDLLVMDSTRLGQDRDIFLGRYTPGATDAMLEPVASINTAAVERDAWLSVDGRRIYFESDRDGALRLYMARR